MGIKIGNFAWFEVLINDQMPSGRKPEGYDEKNYGRGAEGRLIELLEVSFSAPSYKEGDAPALTKWY